MRMIILHPFNPLVRPYDQLDTWGFLGEIRREYGEIVVEHPCYGPYDYGIALRGWIISAVALKTPLIIIEQDIVPTLSQVDQINNCPQPFCVFDYKIPTDKGGQKWSTILERSLKSGDPHYALGFSKLFLESRVIERRENKFKLDVLAKTSWENVAYVLSEIMHELGYDAHIHTDPVVHNHE